MRISHKYSVKILAGIEIIRQTNDEYLFFFLISKERGILFNKRNLRLTSKIYKVIITRHDEKIQTQII